MVVSIKDGLHCIGVKRLQVVHLLFIAVAVLNASCVRLVSQIGLPMQPEEIYELVRNAELAEVNPGEPELSEPSVLFRGTTGRVLPAGSTIVIVDYVTTAGSEHKPYSVWQYVQVKTSPVAVQIGWNGWVHRKALGRAGANPTSAVSTHKLAYLSALCPRPIKEAFSCKMELEAGQPVRVVGCARDGEVAFVQVETWGPDGRYTNGYIRASKLPNSPCL